MTTSLVASKMTIEVSKIAPRIREAYIAVGMISSPMFAFARRQLATCKQMDVICGVHMSTRPELMRELQQLTVAGKITCGAYAKAFLHAKLYLFKLDDGWLAFVGSGNLTDGGWKGNEELFVKVADQDACVELKQKFDDWMEDTLPIDDQFLAVYEQHFNNVERLEVERRKNITGLLDQLYSNFNLDLVDFSGQFFQREDIMAFRPEVTNLDTSEVLEERNVVRRKLFLLNSLLADRIPRDWHLVPHYDSNHIVSHPETKNHHDGRVRSLWVGYGRNKKMLKKYEKSYDSSTGGNNTPLFFMRMQVIVSYEKVGVWLMPGKNGAGQVDREHLLSKLKDDTFADRFFELLTGLGTNYWIEVADDLRTVTSFTSVTKLRNYVARDNWRVYYFIIGRDYPLDDPALSVANIAQTCLADFTKYQPLYEMIRDRSYE